ICTDKDFWPSGTVLCRRINGLGPGLEIEIEARHADDFHMGFFVETLLADRLPVPLVPTKKIIDMRAIVMAAGIKTRSVVVVLNAFVGQHGRKHTHFRKTLGIGDKMARG